MAPHQRDMCKMRGKDELAVDQRKDQRYKEQPLTPFERRSSSRSAIWPALSPQINAPRHRGLQLGTPARPHLGEGRDRCPYLCGARVMTETTGGGACAA